jgi:hypothetical protein
MRTISAACEEATITQTAKADKREAQERCNIEDSQSKWTD